MTRASSSVAVFPPRPWRVALGGVVALAAAMGIGRFAFTPLIPLMARDGTLGAGAAALWAAANYGGYLAGALTAPWFARNPRLGLRLALFGVALATLAMAGLGAETPSAVGVLARAAAGVFSAWALICASGWYLAELTRLRAPRLGGWIYTGVGAGVALAGALTWLGGRQPATWLWLELGSIALLAALLVGRGGSRPRPTGAAASPPRRSSVMAGGWRRCLLIFSYGTFGFGYIVPATFLPAMARTQVADPLVFGITWPLFGLAAAVSVGVASRVVPHWPRRRVWALAQGTMALGTGLTLLSHALWALALSAVLVGGTFMVATMAGLQLAREQAPDNPTPLLSRMTVAFAVGQIVGPLLVRAIGPGAPGGWDAFTWSNAGATGLLAVTAVWLSRGRDVAA